VPTHPVQGVVAGNVFEPDVRVRTHPPILTGRVT
jgi:hypothetical protein